MTKKWLTAAILSGALLIGSHADAADMNIPEVGEIPLGDSVRVWDGEHSFMVLFLREKAEKQIAAAAEKAKNASPDQSGKIDPLRVEKEAADHFHVYQLQCDTGSSFLTATAFSVSLSDETVAEMVPQAQRYKAGRFIDSLFSAAIPPEAAAALKTLPGSRDEAQAAVNKMFLDLFSKKTAAGRTPGTAAVPAADAMKIQLRAYEAPHQSVTSGGSRYWHASETAIVTCGGAVSPGWADVAAFHEGNRVTVLVVFSDEVSGRYFSKLLDRGLSDRRVEP